MYQWPCGRACGAQGSDPFLELVIRYLPDPASKALVTRCEYMTVYICSRFAHYMKLYEHHLEATSTLAICDIACTCNGSLAMQKCSEGDINFGGNVYTFPI